MKIRTCGSLAFLRLAAVVCLASTSVFTGCGGNSTTSSSGSSSGGTTGGSTSPAVLAVTGISPSAVPVGSSDVTLVVTGSGFTSSSVVSVGGTAEATSFVNGNEVHATVPATQLAKGTALSISVANGSTVATAPVSTALAVTNPVPAFTTVSPANVLVGAAPTDVTITGTNFVSGASVLINGVQEPTTFVSATQLTASLTAGTFTRAGILQISVSNPLPGGGASGFQSLIVNNPAPVLTSVLPGTITAGAASATLTIAGSNFVPGSSVALNGAAIGTSYVSDTQLTAALTADALVKAATLQVTVTNPLPGGGASAAASIAVNSPLPVIARLTPAAAVMGGAALDVAVIGSSFGPDTVIQVNGASRPTTYAGPNQVSVKLTSADLASVATLAVTAMNPAPGGGTSAAAGFSVTRPTATPFITSLNPTTLYVGGAETSLQVSGGNLTTTSVVQWNGTALSTIYVNNPGFIPYLLGRVTVDLLASPSTASITIYSPTSAVSTSNKVDLTISNPPAPVLSSVTPAIGAIGADATLTLYGSGFTANTVPSVNGVKLTPTAVTGTSISVKVPGTSLLTPGIYNFTVSTPAPGGGTSASQPYTTYVPIVNNSMIYNPVNGLLYLSIPGSVAAPYGNSIVSMDPATGGLGTPIPVGSEPNKLSLTADGKFLWVGLDGASGVRKVDLTTNTAGLQFALSLNSSGTGNAMALLALPGSTDSVIVLQATNYNSYPSLAIYDGGTLRGTAQSTTPSYALQADSSRSEIYTGGNGLSVFTYNSAGLTPKATNSVPSLASSNAGYDEMQLVSGALSTDFGKVFDAEAGTLLGTFYTTGTTPAQGPTYYDATLGKVFILVNNSGFSGNYTQIQIFNPSDYTLTKATIPVVIPQSLLSDTSYIQLTENRLTRWGSNGLALRTNVGVFTLRSNLVKDLSGTVADLGVALTASGGTATGTSTTYSFTVKNNGPSAATDAAVSFAIPSTGVLRASSSTQGSCNVQTSGCNLGNIPSGSSVTGTVTVLQTASGTATMSAQVSTSSNDTNNANDTATASVTVAGDPYNLTPMLSSISPAAIRAGAGDTTITVTGTNFVSGSTVMLGGTALSTSFSSSTKLTATVPASSVSAMTWSPVSVSSPAPGGGTSNPQPLTVYNVLALAANRMVYDPYSRRLMLSVGNGSSTVAGSSIVAITPATGTIGTPVVLPNTPTRLALSATGQTLYAGNSSAASVARYNMLTDTAETFPVPLVNSYNYNPSFPLDLAVQPGTENSLAISGSPYSYSLAMYDFSTTTRAFTSRSASGQYYSSTCFRFLNSGSLYLNNDSSGLTSYAVSANGLSTASTNSNLIGFNCFKFANGNAYAGAGGVASFGPSGSPVQRGTFAVPSSYSNSSPNGAVSVEPDLSLQQVFFASPSGSTSLNPSTDGLIAYDSNTYLRNSNIALNFSNIEGTSFFAVADIYRWGQDGLAVLTTTGHIYLLRGPFVVPQLLNSNTAAVLTSTSASTIAHGAGNTLLTLTGSNFVPGVAVTWNGSYRTTTIVDATHVTIAVPASDLAAAGSASLVATNPGAAASSAVTVTIQ